MTKNSFSDSFNTIKKFIKDTNLELDDTNTKLLNEINFSPRYLLEIYSFSNPGLAKLINKYLNKDYKIFYNITILDAIELLRMYNKDSPLYEPIFLKKESADNFKEDFKNLKDIHQNGLGKPELEIFMLHTNKLDDLQREEIFKVSNRELKNISKTTHQEIEQLCIKKYASFKEYLIETYLNKDKNSTTCSVCKFKDIKTPFIETNMKYDINENHVDILILSTKPHLCDIMDLNSYTLLKKFLNHYQLDSSNYVIGNIVMCDNGSDIFDKSICPDQPNQLISVCKPTVILALGSKACEALKIEGSINTICGNKYVYEGYDVIAAYHPTYILKNETQEVYHSFGNALQEVRNILFPPNEIEFINNSRKQPGDVLCDGKIYANRSLPKKFYGQEWVLINATRNGFKTIDHIFRNVKTNEKVIRKVPCSGYEYYYMMKNVNNISRPYLNVKDVVCKKGPWKFSPDKDIIEKFNKTIVYEGNVSADVKAIVDYYYYSKPEDLYLPQIFRYDIEHDISDFKGFDTSAPYKITYISAEYNDEYYIWILDSDEIKIDQISTYKQHSGIETKLIINEFAGNESLLLQSFWYTVLCVLDPDIITAWNNNKFDFPYLINRSKRLMYQKNSQYKFSNFDNCQILIDMFTILNRTYNLAKDENWDKHEISGIIVSDLMVLFEQQHQGGLENNSLNFCAELTLNLEKKPFPKSNATKEEWIMYNLWDTELMVLIDKKVQATNYRFFLMKIVQSSWDSVEYAMGIVNGLLLNNAKKTNIVLRTEKDCQVFSPKFITKIVGGFTQTNNGGLYKLLVDYDAASMYPSIMLTFNVGPNTLRLSVDYTIAYKMMINKYDPNENVDVYFSEMNCLNGNQEACRRMKIADVHNIIKDQNYIITPSGAIYCSVEEEKSLFYDVLQTLLEEREITKKSMYNKKNELDIAKYNKQLALKISANAFFGVYLFNKFMFYNTTVGASITMTGRIWVKAIMFMIEKFYNHSNLTIQQIMESIDVMGQQDLPFMKKCIYADTDGTVITMQDIIDQSLPMNEQLNLVETEIKKLNTHIEKCIQDIYPYFNKKHGIKLMKFKEDWVASKGLFYEKKHKRYALHVIREGGKPKDELLLRGIQTRRADSPKLVKEKLEQLLNLILKNGSIQIDHIFEHIEDSENSFYELCQNGSLALGKPVKFGKCLTQYKEVPYQIQGMQLWNALHKREDFIVGSKGFYFKLRYINYDKIAKKFNLSYEEIENIKMNMVTTAIVVPQDYEKMPDYFEIDSKEMVEIVFVTPYTNILEPIIQKTTSTDIPLIDFI